MNNQAQSIQAITANMQVFADAWNIHDGKQLATVFAEDADFVNVAGHWWKGRAELEQGHANAFANHLKNSRIVFLDTHVKFLNPDLAIYHTTWELSGLTSPAGTSLSPKHGILTAIASRDPRGTVQHQAQHQNETWQIIALHNTETIVPRAQ
jgi:uncharacterized protein (TIGR02246 family)